MSLLAAALALAAQAPEWTDRPPPPLPASMYRTMERYRYFIACVATRDWRTVGPMFDTPIGSAREGGYLRMAGGERRGTECSYANLMRMTSILMRGGIAEARYRHVYGRGAVPPVNGEVAAVPQGASFEWAGFNQDSPGLHRFADCLAEREPGAVHQVVMSEYGSPAERAAFQALSRRFGACLLPGQRLRANSLTLRPWLGETLYQRARARQPDAVD